MGRMDLYSGTKVGTPSIVPEAERFLSAALVDGEREDAASMLIAVIDSDFAPSASSRDDLAATVVKHFSDSLGLPFSLDHAKWFESRPARVEVLGHVRQGSQLRQFLVTAFEGEARHVVVTFSVPSGRWDSLSPALTASIESYRTERGPRAVGARGVTWALVALLFSALLVLLAIARARAQAAERGP